jgi:hypothetical protein
MAPESTEDFEAHNKKSGALPKQQPALCSLQLSAKKRTIQADFHGVQEAVEKRPFFVYNLLCFDSRVRSFELFQLEIHNQV